MTAGSCPASCAFTLIRSHTTTTVQTRENTYCWERDRKGFTKIHILMLTCAKNIFLGRAETHEIILPYAFFLCISLAGKIQSAKW